LRTGGAPCMHMTLWRRAATFAVSTPLCIQFCDRCHTNHTGDALTASRRHSRRVWHRVWCMQCCEQVAHPTHTDDTLMASRRHSRRVLHGVVSVADRWRTQNSGGTLTARRRHSRRVLHFVSVLRPGGTPRGQRHTDGERATTAESVAWCIQCSHTVLVYTAGTLTEGRRHPRRVFGFDAYAWCSQWSRVVGGASVMVIRMHIWYVAIQGCVVQDEASVQ
jgi:hypothetical protein